MPYSSFPTLQTVWRVIQQSECQNAKIICDAWHWTRAHQSPENLENIPADRIVAIQVDDAHRLPYKNLRQESRHETQKNNSDLFSGAVHSKKCAAPGIINTLYKHRYNKNSG